ncbi:tetratricopeptide repeat protein [Pelagibacteraceae bacterium]|nr:tetratricopeptide repeat protein [Pelagibacteraceae bacterium]
MIKKENKKSLKKIFAEAVANYQKRNLKIAESLCVKLLSIDPNHFDSIFLLANISAINNDFKKAQELLHKANEIQPDNLSTLNNLGNTYKELGNFDESISYFQKALSINPNHPNANYNLGLIFYKLKEFKKAKNYLMKTVEVQSNYAIAFFSLGNLHVDLKEFESAVSCYQKAIDINPNILGAHNNLGLVFRKLNDFKNAIICYKKAIEIKPDHAGTHHNLALVYKELGDFKKATQSHEIAIKHEPENFSHYFYLSDLKKNIIDSKLANKIKKKIKENNTTHINASFGNYLLARYEKNNKNYEKEMNYLIEGHKHFFELKKSKFELGVKYCFNDVLQISKNINVNKLNHKFDHKIKPIFIIGVPRCGSTLLEKIISSGKNLIPMGEETSIFENYINQKILDKKSLNLGDAQEIREELNQLYKQNDLISKKSNYTFTDKSLNNFFYLNFIKDIYPDAKIINCKRDILSSIMSIFQNNLSELAWTHNLDNIFNYFDNYLKIINEFIKSNPDLVYQVQFENLVKNPEEESKKLMTFCNLSWDKKCLEFYKRKDIVSKTASNVQIRKSIYKHSSNKYLHYKKYLKKYEEKYSWFK